MKHPQYIFAFDKTQFPLEDGITTMGLTELKEAADRSFVLARRHELESDERFGQALPYIVLKNSKGLFTYRRTKLVGEERLAGNLSIGIGGHVDALDTQFSGQSIIDPMSTMAVAIMRELEEELIFKLGPKEFGWSGITQQVRQGLAPYMHGIINDTSNEVGRVHYGLLMTITMPDDYEVRCRESELETLGFIEGAAEGPYENWSAMALEYLKDHKEES